MVTDKSPSSPEKYTNEPNFLKAFIKSLEDRITSLERLSCEKQNIIDKLLEDRTTRAVKENESMKLAQSQVEWLTNENKSFENVN